MAVLVWIVGGLRDFSRMVLFGNSYPLRRIYLHLLVGFLICY